MTQLTSISAATAVAGLAWFFVAAALFFNPVIDKIYRAQEGHAAVRALPQGPSTIGKILLAIAVQTVLWAILFRAMSPALPEGIVPRALAFGALLGVTKMVGRDVDRILLTTYPGRRLVIEFINGLVCAFVVGLVFAWML